MKGLQHHDDPSYNKGYELGYNKGHELGYLKGKQDYNTAYEEGKGVGYLKGKEEYMHDAAVFGIQTKAERYAKYIA